MADDKTKGKKPDEKKKEEAKPAEAAPAAAPAAKSKKPLFIAGGVALLLLVIGTPILIMTLGSGEEKKDDSGLSEVVDEAPEGVAEGAEEQDELDEDEAPLGAMFPLESFVVNLSGGRYVRCQIQLEFVGRDVPARFYTRLIPIRDALIRLLASRSADDLAAEDGYDTLKNDVKELLNTILKKEEIKNVYFTQFVVQ